MTGFRAPCLTTASLGTGGDYVDRDVTATTGGPRCSDDAIREARAATLRVPDAAAAKLAAAGKLHPRERIALLMDAGSFVEDGQFANALATGLPADGVVTGRGTVDGRPALVVANPRTFSPLGVDRAT